MERDHTPIDTTSTPDLQIVGGGLAGLVAANRAVDAGLSVRLIERQTDLGGRAATADHQGYALNVGPHALYLQGELRRALNGFGIDPAGSAPELDGATGSAAGKVGLLPTGPAALARTGLLSARSKAALARIMGALGGTDPAEVASLTVDQWLDGLTSRPDLRTVLWGLTNLSTYNAASDLTSADAAVAQFQMTDGVVYIDGGWGTIVRALAERAARLGVAFVTARAAAVEAGTGTGGSVVVIDGGPRLAGRACLIAAGGPAVADRLLGLDNSSGAPSGGSLVGRAGPAVEASVIDLGLRARPETGVHLGLDTALYATVHSVAADLAPAGRHLVVLARYRHPDDSNDPTWGPDGTRKVLRAHAREMGIDDAEIDMDRYLHSLTVAGGMPLAAQGGLAGRPTVAVAERPGVYVAGDWVGPRGLLADAAAASAVDAVAAIASALRGAGHAPKRSAKLVES